MRPSLRLFLTAVAASASASASAYSTPPRPLRRNLVLDGQIATSYDFVIVGGGTAGLVLASRLSEDSNTSVLVLEAGDTGYGLESINAPADAYYHTLENSDYDWGYTTAPQPNAGNRSIPWSRGKGLGGSSLMNGMYLIRPNQPELDAAAALLPGASENWGWDAMYAAMKSSESFTPPSSAIQQQAAIVYTAASRGSSGPIQATYSDFALPPVGEWCSSVDALGIPTLSDAYSGNNGGCFVATSSVNPANWTRSFARSAYLDPLPPRANLAVLVNSTVTKLVLTNSSSGFNATSVQYAAYEGAPVQTVAVNKEVILAAGVIGSPQILQISGVGPTDVLQAANVPVLVDLPGVGQGLQDHLSTEVSWSTNEQTGASIDAANASTIPTTTSSPFLSFINAATAYVNFTQLLGANATAELASINGALETSAATLVPSTSSAVVAGYKALYNLTATEYLPSNIGAMEILLSLMGTGQGAQTIAVQAAVQHPLSRGQVYITSGSMFDDPVIDPMYLSHPSDVVVMREGLKWARQLGNTQPLASAMVAELSPGPSVNTDEEWDAWLQMNVGTEYHPSSTCAMLPQELGGVVGADLRVYGLENVRVIDASVFPAAMSAHLEGPVYGLAEQAAALIRSEYNPASAPVTSNTSSSAAAGPSSSERTSGAGRAAGPRAAALGLGAAVLVVALAL